MIWNLKKLNIFLINKIFKGKTSFEKFEIYM